MFISTATTRAAPVDALGSRCGVLGALAPQREAPASIANRRPRRANGIWCATAASGSRAAHGRVSLHYWPGEARGGAEGPAARRRHRGPALSPDGVAAVRLFQLPCGLSVICGPGLHSSERERAVGVARRGAGGASGARGRVSRGGETSAAVPRAPAARRALTAASNLLATVSDAWRPPATPWRPPVTQ